MENNEYPMEILGDGLAMLRQIEATKMLWKVEAKANANNAAAASVGNKIQNGYEDDVFLFPAEQRRYPCLTDSLPSRGSFGSGCMPNPGRKDQHYAEHQPGRRFCLDVGSSSAKERVPSSGAAFQENSVARHNQVLNPTTVSSDSSIFSKAGSSRSSHLPWQSSQESPLCQSRHKFSCWQSDKLSLPSSRWDKAQCKEASALFDLESSFPKPNLQCGFDKEARVMIPSKQHFRRRAQKAAIGNLEVGFMGIGLAPKYIDLEEMPEGKQSAVCNEAAPNSMPYNYEEEHDHTEEGMRYLEHIGVEFPSKLLNHFENRCRDANNMLHRNAAPGSCSWEPADHLKLSVTEGCEPLNLKPTNLIHGWCRLPINVSHGKQEQQTKPHSGLCSALKSSKKDEQNFARIIQSEAATLDLLCQVEFGDRGKESRKRQKACQWQQKQQLAFLGKNLCLEYLARPIAKFPQSV